MPWHDEDEEFDRRKEEGRSMPGQYASDPEDDGYNFGKHIVLAHEDGAFTCTRCGAKYRPAMPCSIDMYLSMMKQFGAEHRNCKEKQSEGDTDTEGSPGPG